MTDYNKEYKDHCLTCEHYCLTTNWHEINSSIGFWCKRHGWQDPYDKCSSYDKAYNSDKFIEECLKEFDKKRRYYIVTVCASILGLKEDCEFLTNFKNVCDNYLNSVEGENLLLDYDLYGKMVSDKIYYDFMNPETTEQTKLIVETEIKPILIDINNEVNNNNVKRAILKYIMLTRKLMTRFGILYQASYEEQENKKANTFKVLRKVKQN